MPSERDEFISLLRDLMSRDPVFVDDPQKQDTLLSFLNALGIRSK